MYIQLIHIQPTFILDHTLLQVHPEAEDLALLAGGEADLPRIKRHDASAEAA